MPSASVLPTELAAWLSDPGFTPGAKHFTRLFAALGQVEREDARKLERVLSRGGKAAGHWACAGLAAADARLRGRLLGVVGRVAQAHPTPEFQSALLAALDDADERVRRVVSGALGKLAVPELEGRLLERWQSARALERRSLAEALGKTGSERALRLLRAERGHDPELTRIVERACLMLERDLARATPSRIALDRALGAAQSVLIHCRAGLSTVLADEARTLGVPTVVAPDRIRLSHRGTFGELLRLRTALGFGLEIPLPGTSQDSVATRVLSALQHPDAERAVRVWTEGQARFRMSFAEGGHQRDKVWRVAAAVAQAMPWFYNDPHESTWELIIDTARGFIELCPRRFDDPRFTYRVDDVRAASHPTLAAALARVAGVRADDIVWDPFVGSGLELIERGLLGPFRKLIGTDVTEPALATARANAARAQLDLDLIRADARSHRLRDVSLIISNPPMGRRVARDGSLAPLLDSFLTNAAQALAPSGRLVWLSALPAQTARSARQLGLRVTRQEAVDMGGFSAELQRFER